MSIGNILYLKEEEFVATIITEEEERKIYSVRSEINSLAKSCFFTISEYYKLVRKKIPLKNKIPIYFSDKLLLFTFISDKTHYWVNFFNILKICYDEEIVIIFKNGECLRVNTNKRILDKELNKIKYVLEYINKL